MVISGTKTGNSNRSRSKNTSNKINTDHLPRSTVSKKKKKRSCSKELQCCAHLREDRKVPVSQCRRTSAKLLYGGNSSPGESAIPFNPKHYQQGRCALAPLSPRSLSCQLDGREFQDTVAGQETQTTPTLSN